MTRAVTPTWSAGACRLSLVLRGDAVERPAAPQIQLVPDNDGAGVELVVEVVGRDLLVARAGLDHLEALFLDG